jgi:hypothetical protein
MRHAQTGGHIQQSDPVDLGTAAYENLLHIETPANW